MPIEPKAADHFTRQICCVIVHNFGCDWFVETKSNDAFLDLYQKMIFKADQITFEPSLA